MDSDFDDSSKNEIFSKGNYWWCSIIVCFQIGSYNEIIIRVNFYNHFIHWTVQVTSQSFQAQIKNAEIGLFATEKSNTYLDMIEVYQSVFKTNTKKWS